MLSSEISFFIKLALPFIKTKYNNNSLIYDDLLISDITVSDEKYLHYLVFTKNYISDYKELNLYICPIISLNQLNIDPNTPKVIINKTNNLFYNTNITDGVVFIDVPPSLIIEENIPELNLPVAPILTTSTSSFDILMEDSNGTLFIKRFSPDTPSSVSYINFNTGQQYTPSINNDIISNKLLNEIKDYITLANSYLDSIKHNTENITINAGSVNLDTTNLENIISKTQSLAGDSSTEVLNIQGSLNGIPITVISELNYLNNDNYIKLSFSNLNSLPVVTNTLEAWNLYFNTDIFKEILIINNDIYLFGAGSLKLSNDIFLNNNNLISFIDKGGFISASGINCFKNTSALITLSLPNILNTDISFCENSSVNYLYLPKCIFINDLMNLQNLIFADFTSLESVKDSFLTNANSLKNLSLPSIKVAGNYLLANSVINKFYAPLLYLIGDYGLSNVNTSLEVITPELVFTGDHYLSNTPNLYKLFNPKLYYTGLNSFTGISNKNIIVNLSEYFINSSNEYQNLLSFNNVTEIIADNKRFSKTYNSGTDFTTTYTSDWFICNGFSKLEIYLTLEETDNPPIIEIEGYLNDNHIFKIGNPLIGVSNKTEWTNLECMVKKVRWKVIETVPNAVNNWLITIIGE